MKKLKPREGLIVRDPQTMQPLEKEGEEKEINTYWARRLACGDVLEAQEKSKESTKQGK